MNKIGLQKDGIIKILSEHGINSGELLGAEKLKEAIANVILENNEKLRTQIVEIFQQEIGKMLPNNPSVRRY